MNSMLLTVGGIFLVILVIGAFLQHQDFGRAGISPFLSSWMKNQGLRKYTLVLFTYAIAYFTYFMGWHLWTAQPIMTTLFGLFYLFLFFGAFRKDDKNVGK